MTKSTKLTSPGIREPPKSVSHNEKVISIDKNALLSENHDKNGNDSNDEMSSVGSDHEVFSDDEEDESANSTNKIEHFIKSRDWESMSRFIKEDPLYTIVYINNYDNNQLYFYYGGNAHRTKTALIDACVANAPLDIIQFLFSKSPFPMIYEKDFEGLTCLHAALIGASEQVVNYLLDKCNEECILLLEIRDDDGWTPLHQALFQRRSYKIIMRLIEMDSAALGEKTTDGNHETPFKLFCQIWKDDAQKNICDNKSFPDCIDEDGYNTWLMTLHALLHCLVQVDPPPDLVTDNLHPLNNAILIDSDKFKLPYFFHTLLVMIHHKDIVKQDRFGNCPLHLALTRPGKSIWAETMMDFLPGFAKLQNSQKQFLLISAVENSVPFSTIEKIVHAFPLALSTRDIQTHLYPFMIAAVNAPPNVSLDVDSQDNESDSNLRKNDDKSLSSLNTIYGLLQMSPELVQMGIPSY